MHPYLFPLLCFLSYVANAVFIVATLLDGNLYRGAKLVWAGVKLGIAIFISPALLIFFVASEPVFGRVMQMLWPHLDILEDGDKLYLRRFFLTPKTKWFRPLFLHYIAQSDKGRLSHDHPGAFTTTILRGGYDEHVYMSAGKNGTWERYYPVPLIKKMRPGMTSHNPELHVHMVELLQPTWTFVVGWLKKGRWGFWDFIDADPTNDTWTDSESYPSKGREVKSWE